MPKWIIYILIVLIIVGLIISIYIIGLNWGDKIKQSLISIIGVGTLTILITTFSLLKETKIENDFLTSMLISNETKLPFRVIYSGDNFFWERQDELGSVSYDLNKDPEFKLDSTGNNKVCSTGLQYLILKYLLNLDSKKIRMQQIGNRLILTNHKPELPSDLTDYSGEFDSELTKIDLYVDSPFKLNQNNYFLPQGTKLRVYNSKDSSKYNIIELYKKNYFKFKIKIRGVGKSRDEIAVPNAEIEKTDVTNFYSYSYNIEMSATFDKITSLSTKSEEYKKWIDYIMKEINNYFSDM